MFNDLILIVRVVITLSDVWVLHTILVYWLITRKHTEWTQSSRLYKYRGKS